MFSFMKKCPATSNTSNIIASAAGRDFAHLWHSYNRLIVPVGVGEINKKSEANLLKDKNRITEQIGKVCNNFFFN